MQMHIFKSKVIHFSGSREPKKEVIIIYLNYTEIILKGPFEINKTHTLQSETGVMKGLDWLGV